MRFLRRPVVGASFVLFVFVSLAGCSSGDGPAVGRSSPQLGTSVSPSASSSPSRTLSPQEAAVDVVRQFFAALDKAATTGDTSDVLRLSTPGCGCRHVVASIKADLTGGRHAEGAHWDVRSLTFFGFERKDALVQSSTVAAAYRLINADGTVHASYPAHSRSDLVRLVKIDGQWIIAAFYSDAKK